MKQWSYGVHPSVAHGQAMVRNLAKNTGRDLAAWVALVRASGPALEPDQQRWLKDEYALGKMTATIVIDHAAERFEGYQEDAYLKMAQHYVDAQYSGAKSALIPLFNVLMKLGLELGADVKACPCKTMVPLYRNLAFAEIKPATRTRIDFGLALRHHQGKLPERVLAGPGLRDNNRITHRIAISTLEDIDSEVAYFVKAAYDSAT